MARVHRSIQPGTESQPNWYNVSYKTKRGNEGAMRIIGTGFKDAVTTVKELIADVACLPTNQIKCRTIAIDPL